MKSFIPKKRIGETVGDIVDAMASTDELKYLGRENIFDVIEIFIKEYVGMPGQIVTKKFTKDAAIDLSKRTGLPVSMVVKIVSVFRLRARKPTKSGTKFMKSYNKVKIKGGGVKSSLVSKL
jgi:hypothetical protein